MIPKTIKNHQIVFARLQLLYILCCTGCFK